MSRTFVPGDRIRDRPRFTDRQRVDSLLDALAWQAHLTRTCQHVIDLQRGQVDALAIVIARLEGHNDTDLVRLRHLGDK